MRNFTLQDFLDVYYKYDNDSIEIGSYLLSKLDDDYSKSLLEELKSIEFNYNNTKEEKERITKTLTKVKCWLISHY